MPKMADIRAEVSEQKLSQTPITAFSAADEKGHFPQTNKVRRKSRWLANVRD